MIKSLALSVLLCCALLGACAKEDASDRPLTSSDATAALNAEQVPADLRHLVPLAERWGIGDDVDRNAKVDRATAAEREELRAALEPLQSRITAWLDSFAEGTMTDEAVAFMYMQLALEEMTAGTSR